MATNGQGQSMTSGPSVNDSIFVSDIWYFIDDTGTESFETVKDKNFDDEPGLAFRKIAASNRKRNIWAKANFRNTRSTIDSVSVQLPNASEIIIYIKSQDQLHEVKTGYIHADPQHRTMYERFYFTLYLEPNVETDIFISINNFHRFLVNNGVPVKILNPGLVSSKLAHIVEKETFSSYFYFAFIAFLFFQMFYVSLQWYFAKRIEYAYYLSFISVTCLYFSLRFLNHSSYASSFDWALISAAYINDILLLLPPYFYFLFGRHFLDLKSTAPRLNDLIKAMERIMLVVIIAVLIINYLYANDLPKTTINMTAVSLQFVLAVIGLYHIYFLKTTISRFVLIGSAIAFFGHILALCVPLFFPGTLLTKVSPIHFTMMGVLFEIGVFNSGLLFKARLVELARIETQQSLIDELERRQLLQTEYASVREKISSDLHDDLGSNLSSIGVFTYAARKVLAKNALKEAENLIDQIEQRAQESLQSLSDLVWSVNPINDNSEKLIARVISFIKSLTQARGIQFDANIDSDFYSRTIDQLEKRNIQLLIKEAINNIIKHAKAQFILLSIEKQNNTFCIKIVDDGAGFNTSTPADGNGLRGMKKRVEEINGSFSIVSQPGRTEVCLVLAERPMDRKL